MEDKRLKMNIQMFAEGDDGTEPNKELNNPTVDGLLAEISKLKINTVSKEEYQKILEDNAKLITEVTSNRKVEEPQKELKKEDIIKRCEERTQSIGEGNSLETITALVENYRDMETLGMNVEAVDEGVIVKLEEIIKTSDGDATYFQSLMEKNIAVQKKPR